MAYGKQEFDAALEQIFRRAVTDSSYRKLCMTDAAAAYKAATGSAPPSELKLRFVESQGGEVTVVLPNLAPAAGEISDEALSQVSGGGFFADVFYGCDRTCTASAGSAVVAACGPTNPH